MFTCNNLIHGQICWTKKQCNRFLLEQLQSGQDYSLKTLSSNDRIQLHKFWSMQAFTSRNLDLTPKIIKSCNTFS